MRARGSAVTRYGQDARTPRYADKGQVEEGCRCKARGSGGGGTVRLSMSQSIHGCIPDSGLWGERERVSSGPLTA